jgi:lipoate-protein ligase A
MDTIPYFQQSTWRLLHTPPATGCWNMAVDEAILEAAGCVVMPPTLRLYAWQPACLSLGYAQPIADVDRTRLNTLGWHLVRRPTGGRAILHTDELTYAVIAPANEPRLVGGVLESYQRLAQALLLALHLLNLPVTAQETYSTPGAPKSANPICFEVPSNYEITANGKKLVGSAQARRREGILQHGSLPLHGDLTRITWVLKYPDESSRETAAARLLERAATAESLLGYPLPWEHAAQAFSQAFSQVLNLNLQSGELSSAEKQRADELVVTKYTHPSWNERI